MTMGPHTSRVACLVLLAAIPPLWAARQGDEGSGAVQAGSDLSEDGARAITGTVLRERYVLSEFLERRAVPGRSFPQITRRGLERGEHLGQGSFGDVWKAYDTQLQKHVAVKIFYVNSKPYGPRYLTWTDATQYQKQELRENAKECKLIKDMLGHSTMGAGGASRICACYAEHVLDAEHTSKVTFLVQEMCGRSLTKHFLEPHRRQRTVDVKEARKLTMQLVEGLEFLQKFTPPIIHHDLKPDNICVGDEGVKIIDWGGVVFASNGAMYEPAVATPLYTPPEADGKPGRYPKAFEMPAYSYDVYASGLVFMEMLCPALDSMAWYNSRPLSEASITAHVARACPQLAEVGPDLRVIGRMTNQAASGRPSPMDLLEDPLFAPHEANPVLPPTGGPGHRAAERFSVGDHVEYWSTTHKKWMSGIIVSVHPSGRTYDIDQENGQRLKYGAPVERIRRQGLKFKAGDRVEYMSSSRRMWLPGRILRVNEDSRTYDVEYTYSGQLYTRQRAQPDNVRSPPAHVDMSYRPDPGRRFSQFHHGAPGANRPGGRPWQPQLIHPIIEQQGEDEEDRNGQYQLGSEISLDDPTVRGAGGPIEVGVWVKCDYNVGCSYDRVELQNAARGAKDMPKDMPITYRGEASGIALASLTVARDDPWVGSVCKVQAFGTTAAGKKVKSLKKSVFVRP